jgi:hypothetical protein
MRPDLVPNNYAWYPVSLYFLTIYNEAIDQIFTIHSELSRPKFVENQVPAPTSLTQPKVQQAASPEEEIRSTKRVE